MKQMLNAALVFATTNHDGQFDKGGKPYILHVLTVMHKLRTTDEELMCAAVLHDVIEDTNATFKDLENIGMSDRVIAAVRLLTKQNGQTNEEYLEGILTNIDAIRIKKADITHNLDVRRIKGLREKDFARMQKYTMMYAVLDEAEKNWK